MTMTQRERIIMFFVLVLAIGGTIIMVQSPGFKVTPVLLSTMIGIILAGFLAWVLFRQQDDRAHDVGAELISGVIFLLAAAMTQAAGDVNDFRNRITFEHDLHGFDPEGRSLRGFNFRGKDLSVANLKKADLRHAHMREAILSTADLSGANLSSADLFYAQLHEADVHGANFSRSNLHGAKFGTGFPHNIDSATFSGALVSDDTCWRIPTSTAKGVPNNTPTPRGRETIDYLLAAGLEPPATGRPLGHVCTAEEEAGEPPPKKKTPLVYLCDKEPYLRKAEGLEHAKDALYCWKPS
jgi:hypothetical protein